MVNESHSSTLEPLLRNQLMQEAMKERQYEGRQQLSRHASNNQRFKNRKINQ